MAQTPLDELQHRSELGKNDRLGSVALASLLVEFIQERLDFGRRGPIFHGNAVDDGILLGRLLRVCKRWLFQINGKGYVAAWAVNVFLLVLERLYIVFGTLAAEVMAALGSNCIFGWFVTNTTHCNVEPWLRVFLQDKIWMVCDLAHLHDQAEDVGIVVQHDTTADICIKLSGGIGHDAA